MSENVTSLFSFWFPFYIESFWIVGDFFNRVLKKEKVKEILSTPNTIYKHSLPCRLIVYAPVLVAGHILNLVFYQTTFLVISTPYICNLLADNVSNTQLYKDANLACKRYLMYITVKFYYLVIKKLDDSLIDIKLPFDQNDKLFCSILKQGHFGDFFQNFSFIALMYFLREYTDQTYYYYKAIKTSYYINTKYNFNVMSVVQAKIQLYKIFTEKQYYRINSLEYAHAFYRILVQIETQDKKPFWKHIQELLFKVYNALLLIWTITWIIGTTQPSNIKKVNFSLILNTWFYQTFVFRTIVLKIAIDKVYKKQVSNYGIVITSLIGQSTNWVIIATLYTPFAKLIDFWGNATLYFLKTYNKRTKFTSTIAKNA